MAKKKAKVVEKKTKAEADVWTQETEKKKPKVKMTIDKWTLLACVAAVFNPVPTGVLAGYVLYTDQRKKTGTIIIIASLVLFALALALAFYFGGPVI